MGKFNQNKDDILRNNRLNEMHQLMATMNALNDTINEYQDDMRDIIEDLKVRTNKLKSNTFTERIDELNNICNDLQKQIEILAEDLTKFENEQLTAERSAEELRNRT